MSLNEMKVLFDVLSNVGLAGLVGWVVYEGMKHFGLSLFPLKMTNADRARHRHIMGTPGTGKAELAGMTAKDVALKLKEIANGKASMWTLMWQGWKLRMFGLRVSIREYGPAIAISAGLATLIALGCLAWWELNNILMIMIWKD